MKTVAIIGGGFCGTVAAVNLARLARHPLRVIVINHGNPIGRGIAYGTKQPDHLLNVAARNMSAFPEQPHHFVEWLGTRSEYADMQDQVLREQFAPRRVYGDYLQSLLFWHRQSPGHAETLMELIDGEVLDVVPSEDQIALVVSQHPTIMADMAILAIGNQPPEILGDVTAEFDHPRYLSNPWKPVDYVAADPQKDVVLLGAGLTMIDVFLTLSALDWQGTIHAVSRTGLLPLPHFQGIAYTDFPLADPTSLGLSELVRLMMMHCDQLRERGENAAIVVDKLRPFTQRIWQNFTVAEKQRFCREFRTRWNVMRHRIARSIHDRLTSAMALNSLRILQGRLHGMAAHGSSIQVTIEGSAPNPGRTLIEAAWVINCTGPQESYRHSKSTLVQNLFDRGLIQADDMDMGIRVGPDFSVIGGDGMASRFLLAIGPMLKGTLWETTAVPELRIQALHAAERILEVLHGGPAPSEFAEMWADVIEYVI